MSKFVFNNEQCAKFRNEVDIIKQNLKVDSEGNIVEVTKGDCYKGIMGDDITIKEVEKVRKFDENFLKACEIAIGEKAAEHFIEHPHSEKVSASISGVGCKVNTTVTRQKTYTNNFAKEGESREVVKNFIINTRADFVSTRSISSLRDAMAEEVKHHIKK